jgi:hypothetical protein
VTAPASWRNRIVGEGEEAPEALDPNPANWRTHPKPQARALEGALTEVGWVQRVIVNRRTGHLLDGHLRRELAIARGEPTLPVLYVDLSEEEERLVLATLDPLGSMAATDAVKLEELLRDLAPDDAALRQMLLELADEAWIVRSGQTDPDDLPPEPDPADVYIERGTTYQLGALRLACGDATDSADVGRLLAGAKPILLATHPPDGVGLDLGWRDVLGATPGGQRSGRANEPRRTTIAGDTRRTWADAYALVRSLTVGYVWHAGIHAAEVAVGLERIGFEIVAQLIWDKGQFALSHGWYHWAHEPAWVVRKAGISVPYLGPHTDSTIWRAPSPKRSSEAGPDAALDHPTQKPVVLFEIPIRNHLRPGEALYDPFVGSGTALIAAERLGRPCFAMEIDPRVTQLALERWEAFTGQKAVRDA